MPAGAEDRRAARPNPTPADPAAPRAAGSVEDRTREDEPVSLYYEDVEIGTVYESPGRTITESDVVAFAALSGDWNRIHTDAEYAKTTPFGQRIAHGLLGIAIASGLAVRLGTFADTTIAMLGVDWTFRAPVFIGDTVHLRISVVSKRRTSRGARGLVVRRLELVNQHGAVVQDGTISLMVTARSAEGE